MLATRLSKSSLLVLKRADGEVDPSCWVLLNPRNATDGTLQPEEAKLGHTKGLPTQMHARCLLVTRRRVERKLYVFVFVRVCVWGNVTFWGMFMVVGERRAQGSQRWGVCGRLWWLSLLE